MAGKREKRNIDCVWGGFRVLGGGGVVANEVAGRMSYEGTKVMIVGAGTMSKLLVKHLESKRCTEMTILNRTKPRAEALGGVSQREHENSPHGRFHPVGG